MSLRHPPGRAGRLWLHDRLRTARHGAELLRRKEDVLRRDERRLAALEERTGAAWERRCRDAEAWAVRALVLGGREALERAALGDGHAQADVRWRSSMGVTYAGEATCRLPAPTALGGPSALALAADAYRIALDAAVQHAAAADAHARVAAELTATTRRLRAVRDRWVPRLDEALQALDLRLDEAEREEVVRVRWAAAAGEIEGGS
ncbi:MAG: V-type ATP synthase subunit D [Acidimicrobiales bacterium]|nr:V-type ATP synthase subunit D [Acidimicrobiales bacterium]